MQADIVVPSPKPVERVESPDGGMAFEDADGLVKVSESDSCSQPGQTCSNDNRIVCHGRAISV